LGLSRGGIACMKLARVLSAAPDLAAAVDLHALLFDPVPGNSLATGVPFTARNSYDLSSCHSLRSVLALYPHQPLPAAALHAPVLPKYPPGCAVEEDVTLGCHQAALFHTAKRPGSEVERASTLACHRIARFLASHGVCLRFSGLENFARYHPTAADCLAVCRQELQRPHGGTRRALHGGTGRGRRIVRAPGGAALVLVVDGACENAPIPRFLNRHHEILECEAGNVGDNGNGVKGTKRAPSYMLDIAMHKDSKSKEESKSCAIS
jgi:hypothetical protein